MGFAVSQYITFVTLSQRKNFNKGWFDVKYGKEEDRRLCLVNSFYLKIQSFAAGSGTFVDLRGLIIE